MFILLTDQHLHICSQHEYTTIAVCCVGVHKSWQAGDMRERYVKMIHGGLVHYYINTPLNKIITSPIMFKKMRIFSFIPKFAVE